MELFEQFSLFGDLRKKPYLQEQYYINLAVNHLYVDNIVPNLNPVVFKSDLTQV